MAEAKKNNWTVISMKNDWKAIFSARSEVTRPLGVHWRLFFGTSFATQELDQKLLHFGMS